jgi:drug/metabolite transporter (DMT)-like permease
MTPTTRPPVSILGPALVILGASMWGLETLWRTQLSSPSNEPFNADVLVFHEHWAGLIVTLPFLIAGARKLKGVTAHAWLSIILSGVFGSALGAVFFTLALGSMNNSVANLLLNVQPIISVFVTWFWLGERPRSSFYPWAAVALLCGLAMAVDPEGLRRPSDNLAVGLACVGATALCWGASTTFGRGAMLQIDFATGAGLRYIVGFITMSTVIAVRGETSLLHFGALSNPANAKALALLVLVSGVTPTFIYFSGLARSKASVATFAEMAQTFASLLITWGYMGQALTPLQLGAGVVLLTSVWFINRTVDEGPAHVAALSPGPGA